MGIFNESSNQHYQFAKGFQGAPGWKIRENFVGINEAFPMKNYLHMGSNFIYNLKTPINNDQRASKGYVDSAITADYQKKTNIDLKNIYNVNNSKKRSAQSSSSNKNTLVSLAEGEEHFVNINNNTQMWAKIDTHMNNNQTEQKQPTTLTFTDNKYLHRDGTAAMTNDLNMDNKKIINLRQPTDDTDAANKKYVDDNKVDFSSYIKVDGTNKMAGDLNMENNKIINLNDEPTTGTDAVNKNYVDSVVSHSHVKPSHQKDQFSYLMSNVLQWSDEMDGGCSRLE